MKKIYTIIALSLSLCSETFQESIHYGIQNSYQLQILKEESSIIGEQKEIASLWDDPLLKVGINDIQSDYPLSRNVEAMQNHYISISQTIPLSNRLKEASAVEEQKRAVVEQKIEALKVEIAFGIRKAFIEATYAKKRLKILDDYIAFLERPLELLSNLSAIERESVDSYIKTELLQNSYQLQRESLLEKIAIAKERVELIGQLKIETFSNEVPLKHYEQYPLEELLVKLKKENPQLLILASLQEVAKKGVRLAQEKQQADITVTGGYYQRFERNDYVSFGVAYPLYTHGKQEREKTQAMKRVNIEELNLKQQQIELKQSLKIALHELKKLYQELDILQKSSIKILQRIEHAKLALSSGASLLSYYQLFTQKVENALAINQKRLLIALIENQISKLLGEIE